MKHATEETHRSLFASVMGLIRACGEFFAADLRAELRTVHVNPLIDLRMPPIWTGLILPNGHVFVKSDQMNDLHFGWLVDRFNIAPALSLDPKTDYLNGKQIVDANGVLTGHAHLHVCPLADWPQATNALNGKPGVELPEGYIFIGGHDWYRSDKQPDGRFLITTVMKAMKLKAGTTYIFVFDLVHVDDTLVTSGAHGQRAGRLETIVETSV